MIITSLRDSGVLGKGSLFLQAPELAFQPSLEQDSPGSFFSLVEGLLDDVFGFTKLVPRVAAHKEMEDYHSDVEEVRG